MVAETNASGAVRSRKRKPGERGPEIPILSKLQARNLYLNEGLPYRAISERTGIPVETLHPMASKEGWVAARREQKARLIASQDAKGDELRRQAEESLAARATEISKKALDVTEAGLDLNDLDGAKQAQAASSALKNLITSARVLQTQPGSMAGAAEGNAFNFFFIQPTAPVAHHEVKQVTEIEETKP